MTPKLRRAIEREKACTGPEPIRPIVRRVVEEIGETYPAFLEDPAVSSLWGEPVES